ncbi:MAG TPA: acetylxylan esterase [Chloroflexota bacterium]|nr:acetylxylan esterase [Chloroflexota bacterium]
MTSVAVTPASALSDPSTALARHFDSIRDATVPALRFDRAGLPFSEWRATLRPRLRDVLGLPDAAGPRLRSAEVGEWHQERDENGTEKYRWRRVWLQTEPELWVPAFFVLPEAAALQSADGRVPVLIAAQGHSKDGMRVSLGLVAPEVYERSIAQGDRDLALQAARHGYACLALEMRGFGELRLPADREKDAGNSCGRLSSLSIQVGRTLLGMRVHDVIAAVDYLSDLPEIDASRIVLSGNSGGGTVTLTTGALEDRLAATVPSSAFCTFAASIQGVHHCACNFVPWMSTLCDMSDLAGLAAPHPQLIVNGKEDPIFPIDGVQEAFARTQQIYAAAGAPDAVQLYVGDGGHRYYAAPVWPWLAESLRLSEEWGRARFNAEPPAVNSH